VEDEPTTPDAQTELILDINNPFANENSVQVFPNPAAIYCADHPSQHKRNHCFYKNSRPDTPYNVNRLMILFYCISIYIFANNLIFLRP